MNLYQERRSLCRLGNGFLGDFDAFLHFCDGVFWVGFVFQGQRTVSGELDLAEGLEEADHVEVSLADDDVLGAGSLFNVVLDVSCKDAWSELHHGIDGVFAGADEVAAIDAGADVGVTLFDGLYNAGDLVVKGAWAVVVNRDADVVFCHKLVEAIERIGLWIGSDDLHARLLSKFKELLVGFVIFGEAMYAVTSELDAVIGKELERFGNFGSGSGRREMLAKKFGVVQAHAVQVANAVVQVEVAERVALSSDRESTESVVGEIEIGCFQNLGNVKPQSASSRCCADDCETPPREASVHGPILVKIRQSKNGNRRGGTSLPAGLHYEAGSRA